MTLELSQAQEIFLRQRAAETEQEPAEYILTAAGITSDINSKATTHDDAETNSAYDLFRGLTGGFASGNGHLSEQTGKAFAEGMAAKQREGHL